MSRKTPLRAEYSESEDFEERTNSKGFRVVETAESL